MRAFLKFLKKHAVLVTVSLVLFILIILFHELITPFIIALIIVYLIEPMVNGMNKIHIGKHHLPRGVAVLCAYLLFLLALTGIGFAFVPALTSEISQATEELPKYYSRIKDEEIPKLSQKADEILFRISRHDPKEIPVAIEDAKNRVHQSLDAAFDNVNELTLPDIDTSGAKPLLVNGERHNTAKPQNSPKSETAKSPVLLKLHQTQKGEFEVLAGDHELLLKAGEDGSYIIKPNYDEPGVNASSFNLEREINKTVVSAFESSTQYAGSALSVLQSIIQVVVNTFVQFILVFMLAAFISIDSPKLMAYIRGLFENKKKEATGYDEFKGRLTKGLAGVVRGQLIICCIDGFLTGVGLAIIGVDFALLLGIVGGFLCIIPIFGTIILMIPAVLLALIKGPVTAMLVIVVILLIHFCDTNFFTPKIVGKSSNLHPVIIIFALLAGEQLAGVLGLILAVPVTSMLKTTIQYILEKSREEDSDDNKTDVDPEKLELAYAAAQAAVQVMTAPGIRQVSIASAHADQVSEAFQGPNIESAPVKETASERISSSSEQSVTAVDRPEPSMTDRQLMNTLKKSSAVVNPVENHHASPRKDPTLVLDTPSQQIKFVSSGLKKLEDHINPSDQRISYVDENGVRPSGIHTSASVQADQKVSLDDLLSSSDSNQMPQNNVKETVLVNELELKSSTQSGKNTDVSQEMPSARRSITIHKGAK